MSVVFASCLPGLAVEAGDALAPRCPADGLMPFVTIGAGDGMVPMVGRMTRDALRPTIEVGSRSRRCFDPTVVTCGASNPTLR